MKRKKLLLTLASVAMLAFLILALRPIGHVTLDQCVIVRGEVQAIQAGETGDIGLYLKHDPTHYYLNRGVQQGLTAEGLRQAIGEQAVTLHYARHWTPLDPLGRHRHIVRASVGEKILFDKARLSSQRAALP